MRCCVSPARTRPSSISAAEPDRSAAVRPAGEATEFASESRCATTTIVPGDLADLVAITFSSVRVPSTVRALNTCVETVYPPWI